jgi:hypothetical protein
MITKVIYLKLIELGILFFFFLFIRGIGQSFSFSFFKGNWAFYIEREREFDRS